MNDKETIGARIKTLRQKHRWTQEKLVEVARLYVPPGKILNRPNVSAYEGGKARPDTWVIVAIAKAFGVSVEYLMGQDEPFMLTPEPELWDAVNQANKYPPETRRVLAQILLNSMALISLEKLGTPTEGERRAQELADWVETPATDLALGSLLDSEPHGGAIRQTPDTDESHGEEHAPDNHTAGRG